MTLVPRPRFVDFHCHLDLYPDHAAAVAQREHEGVFTLAVTTTPKAWARNRQLADTTRYVRAALGLHPQLVGERGHEICLWKELLPQSRYVGEVGLDAGPRFYSSFEQQKHIFKVVLIECAAAGNKILSVHSVRSSKIVLDMIEQHLPPTQGRVVLHWFTGSAKDVRRAVDLGCYFSVNSAMLASEKRRKLVHSIPADRLLTETDGPFTETQRPLTRPASVDDVVAGLAGMYSKNFTAMAHVIEGNLKQLLVEMK